MLKHCVVRGKNIGYFDSGAPENAKGTLLLVHCSGASHRIFKQYIEHLSQGYRILAPDLLGYGASESWPDNEPYHWQYDVDILLTMLRIANTPVHCLGYSYGAYLLLETCLQSPQQMASLSLAEPSTLHVLHEHDDKAVDQNVKKTAERCIAALANHELRKAAAIHLKFWGSPASWWFAPKSVKQQLQSKLPKMIKEYLAQQAHGTPLEGFAQIQKPVLMFAGRKSQQAVKIALELLAQTIPGANVEWIENANHVTLFEKYQQVLPLAQTWLEGQVTPRIPPAAPMRTAAQAV